MTTRRDFVVLMLLILKIDLGMPRDAKILNGKPTQIELFPFLVGLYYFDTFICAGSIISKNLVLTAGHCICEDYTTADTVKVLAGSTNLEEQSAKSFTIKSIKCHEKLSISDHLNDVALIKICGEFQDSTNMQSVALIKGGLKVPVGTMCEIVGWGYTQHNITNFVPKLRYARVPISDLNHCMKEYKTENVTLTTDMMCAGYPEGKTDACKGDSGGPLLCKKIQTGVVSFGNSCGLPRFQGVYTDLSKYEDWIKKSISTM